MSASVRDDDNGFAEPDWSASLDVAAAIAACPADATIKGLMENALLDACDAAGVVLAHPRVRVQPFQPTPLRPHMQLIADAASALFPKDPLRLAFRRFGRGVRATILTTPYGRVLLGRPMDGAETLLALSRCYQVMLGYSCTVDVTGERSADVAMHDVHHFLDTIHVGVFEGLFAGSGLKARVRVKLDDIRNGTFRVRW